MSEANEQGVEITKIDYLIIPCKIRFEKFIWKRKQMKLNDMRERKRKMTKKQIQQNIREEENNVNCHLQAVGMGTLICRAADRSGEYSTNEVTPDMCAKCEVGRIYREIGCDSVTAKIRIIRYLGGASLTIESIFCSIKKTFTNFEECSKCNLITAKTTRKIVTTARGIFETHGFYSAYKDIEKARKSIRDGNFDDSITSSIACLESTMKICHEKFAIELPKRKQVTDLWKSTREMLKFDEIDETESLLPLLNTISGLVTQLGGLRNALGDAHGKGIYPPEVSESIAELAINISATLSTLIIRRYIQVKGDKNDN